MDSDTMFPEGDHPSRRGYKRDLSELAPYVPRSTDGVHAKYYFIDFKISVRAYTRGPFPENCYWDSWLVPKCPRIV